MRPKHRKDEKFPNLTHSASILKLKTQVKVWTETNNKTYGGGVRVFLVVTKISAFKFICLPVFNY